MSQSVKDSGTIKLNSKENFNNLVAQSVDGVNLNMNVDEKQNRIKQNVSNNKLIIPQQFGADNRSQDITQNTRFLDIVENTHSKATIVPPQAVLPTYQDNQRQLISSQEKECGATDIQLLKIQPCKLGNSHEQFLDADDEQKSDADCSPASNNSPLSLGKGSSKRNQKSKFFKKPEKVKDKNSLNVSSSQNNRKLPKRTQQDSSENVIKSTKSNSNMNQKVDFELLDAQQQRLLIKKKGSAAANINKEGDSLNKQLPNESPMLTPHRKQLGTKHSRVLSECPFDPAQLPNIAQCNQSVRVSSSNNVHGSALINISHANANLNQNNNQKLTENSPKVPLVSILKVSRTNCVVPTNGFLNANIKKSPESRSSHSNVGTLRYDKNGNIISQVASGPAVVAVSHTGSLKKQVKFSMKLQIHQYEKANYNNHDDDGNSVDSSGDDHPNGNADNNDSEEELKELNDKMVEEQRNYLYNKRSEDMFSHIKKPFHKFIIPPDDPVFKHEYNALFLKDKEQQRKIYNEFKVCKNFTKRRGTKSLQFEERMFKTLRKAYQRKTGSVPNYILKADGTKKYARKTIVFDLDSTLIKSAYKKHKLADYDAYVTINIIGNKRMRLYVSFRPYAREMLDQLYQDFELILYSSQSRDYNQQVARLLTLNTSITTQSNNPNYEPTIFHHILGKTECIYLEELDVQVSDLDVISENRNIKDIIFVTDQYSRGIKHIRNVVPVKPYNGNKKDYSLVALARYLKGFTRIRDVREKIQQDFKTIDI